MKELNLKFLNHFNYGNLPQTSGRLLLILTITLALPVNLHFPIVLP